MFKKMTNKKINVMLSEAKHLITLVKKSKLMRSFTLVQDDDGRHVEAEPKHRKVFAKFMRSFATLRMTDICHCEEQGAEAIHYVRHVEAEPKHRNFFTKLMRSFTFVQDDGNSLRMKNEWCNKLHPTLAHVMLNLFTFKVPSSVRLILRRHLICQHLKKQPAFTLAELMISLVIIAVITVVLYPTIADLAPNNNKYLFKTTYKTIESIVGEIVDTNTLSSATGASIDTARSDDTTATNAENNATRLEQLAVAAETASAASPADTDLAAKATEARNAATTARTNATSARTTATTSAATAYATDSVKNNISCFCHEFRDRLNLSNPVSNTMGCKNVASGCPNGKTYNIDGRDATPNTFVTTNGVRWAFSYNPVSDVHEIMVDINPSNNGASFAGDIANMSNAGGKLHGYADAMTDLWGGSIQGIYYTNSASTQDTFKISISKTGKITVNSPIGRQHLQSAD